MKVPNWNPLLNLNHNQIHKWNSNEFFVLEIIPHHQGELRNSISNLSHLLVISWRNFLRFSQAFLQVIRRRVRGRRWRDGSSSIHLLSFQTHTPLMENGEEWKKEEEEKGLGCWELMNGLKVHHHLLISLFLHLNPSLFHYLHIESNEWSFESIHVEWNHAHYGS